MADGRTRAEMRWQRKIRSGPYVRRVVDCVHTYVDVRSKTEPAQFGSFSFHGFIRLSSTAALGGSIAGVLHGWISLKAYARPVAGRVLASKPSGVLVSCSSSTYLNLYIADSNGTNDCCSIHSAEHDG